MRVVFVHGACVRDGDWWWHLAARELEQDGIASVAPGLPSCGESGRAGGPDGPGLADDVDAVRAVLDTDEPTVVVAHSYGGIVVAEAAAGVASVRHLVYVSSYLPEPGQSLGDFGGDDGPADFLAVDLEGLTLTVRPERLAETFMHDCPPDVAAEAQNHLVLQSLSVTQAPVREAAWQDIPSTYVVCALDRGTPADRQREFARRATHVYELPAGHHPFLSRPGEFAALVRSR